MQVFDCNVGAWKAQARVEEIDPDRVMATIHVLNRENGESVTSRHTVVFEHKAGCDTIEETRAAMHQLLGNRYGF